MSTWPRAVELAASLVLLCTFAIASARLGSIWPGPPARVHDLFHELHGRRPSEHRGPAATTDPSRFAERGA